MDSHEAQRERHYILNLLLTEGRGQQTVIIITLKHLASPRLIEETRLEPLMELLDKITEKYPRQSRRKKHLSLLEPEDLQQVYDCAVKILLDKQDAHPELHQQDPADFDPPASIQLDLPRRKMLALFHHQNKHPAFSYYLACLSQAGLDLDVIFAAMLGPKNYKIS